VKTLYNWVAALCVSASLAALLYTFYWGEMAVILLFALNSVLVAIMWGLAKAAKLAVASAPLYMAFLWPGIGPLFLYLYSFRDKGEASEGEQLREYQKYIEAMHRVHGVRLLSAVDEQAEANILTGYDVMRLSTPAIKKDFMIGAKGQDLPARAGVLKKALRDADPEVRHYAAAMMAALSNECEKKIQTLKERAQREPDLLLPLIDFYDRYLKSGVLAREIKQEFAKEHLALLWQAKGLWPRNYDVAVKLLNALMERSMYAEARHILPEIAENFPEMAFSVLLEMRLEFLQGNYRQVAAGARRIREAGWVVPETYKRVVDYWG